MSYYHIETSLLTNTIYVGTVSTEKPYWLKKEDRTAEACAAVAQHVLKFGEPVIVKENGKDKYKITVEELNA